MAASLQFTLKPVTLPESSTKYTRRFAAIRFSTSPPSKSYTVTLLPGDGIGPEVVSVAKNALQLVASIAGIKFKFNEMPMGGAALDLTGVPLPEETLSSAKQSDAVLLGAIGGYKWDNNEKHLKPETGLLQLSEGLKVFANLRPATILPQDESLRRWKEKLLGCLESDLNGQMEPEVKFQSIGIISSDFGELSRPLPITEDQSKRVLFSLREGSDYRLKLTFTVLHNIVSGLAYTNAVWKSGIQVDQSKGMLGTFAPQREPYVHTLEEETTPSGVLARGTYTAKLKFEDDDKRCHMELNYSFEIRKNS